MPRPNTQGNPSGNSFGTYSSGRASKTQVFFKKLRGFCWGGIVWGSPPPSTPLTQDTILPQFIPHKLPKLPLHTLLSGDLLRCFTSIPTPLKLPKLPLSSASNPSSSLLHHNSILINPSLASSSLRHPSKFSPPHLTTQTGAILPQFIPLKLPKLPLSSPYLQPTFAAIRDCLTTLLTQATILFLQHSLSLGLPQPSLLQDQPRPIPTNSKLPKLDAILNPSLASSAMLSNSPHSLTFEPCPVRTSSISQDLTPLSFKPSTLPLL